MGLHNWIIQKCLIVKLFRDSFYKNLILSQRPRLSEFSIFVFFAVFPKTNMTDKNK